MRPIRKDELYTGMRVIGESYYDTKFYGEITSINTELSSAHVQRDDFRQGILWVVALKDDESWGANLTSGTLYTNDEGELPWE